MPGRFFLFPKKRGDRRTGARWFGRLGEGLFYFLLFLAGVIGVWLTASRYILPEWRANQYYVQGIATVVSARVVSKATDGGLYRPEIVLQYEARGELYQQDTYDAVYAFSMDLAEAQRRAREFEVGGTYVCWYDSRDPTKVVVVRGYRVWPWILMLVPVTFTALGGVGLGTTWLQSLTSVERRTSLKSRTTQGLRRSPQQQDGRTLFAIPPVDNVVNSPGTQLRYRLPSDISAGWSLAARVALTVLWNGCVVGIAIVASQGRAESGLLVSLGWIPFAIIGGVLLFVLTRSVWRATAVGATRIEVSDHPFRPGGCYDVLIAQAGRLHVSNLEVLLECRERATFRQGTDTRTSTAIVVYESVYAREDIDIRPTRPFEERFQIEIAPQAMHSFQTDHNEVAWSLIVIGRTDRRADYERRFPVCVYPGVTREPQRD